MKKFYEIYCCSFLCVIACFFNIHISAKTISRNNYCSADVPGLYVLKNHEDVCVEEHVKLHVPLKFEIIGFSDPAFSFKPKDPFLSTIITTDYVDDKKVYQNMSDLRTLKNFACMKINDYLSKDVVRDVTYKECFKLDIGDLSLVDKLYTVTYVFVNQ